MNHDQVLNPSSRRPEYIPLEHGTRPGCSAHFIWHVHSTRTSVDSAKGAKERKCTVGTELIAVDPHPGHVSAYQGSNV